MSEWMVVTPAYGRDYKTAQEAVHDWVEGKDFVLQPHGHYTSIRDWKDEDQIEIRYYRNERLTVYTRSRPWHYDGEDDDEEAMHCDRCGMVIDETEGIDGMYWGNCTECGDNLCIKCAGSWGENGECERCSEA